MPVNDQERLELDRQMRRAAFRQLARLNVDAAGGLLKARDVWERFPFEHDDYPLVAQYGIWKPAVMAYVLSLRASANPSQGGYDDQVSALDDISRGAESVAYAFMGDNPDHWQNQHLLDTFRARAPVIYFLNFPRSRYIGVAPAYISEVDLIAMRCRLVFGAPDRGPAFGLPGPEERREGMRVVRDRLQRLELI